MKIILKKTGTVLLSAMLCILTAAAQELPKGYKVTMDMTVDEKGDVTVSSVTQYNAQYWDIVKSTKALEPSVMKNTLKRQFPKYQITDFEIDSKTKEADRTSMTKFKILGSMKVDANGKWFADLDTKSPDVTKVSDTKFVLIDETSAQKITINLPSSASDAKVEKDSFGKYNLTYTAPVSGGGLGNIIKYLGILVAAGGAFLFFKGNKLKTLVVSDAQNKKVNYQQPKHIDDAIVINPVQEQKIKPGNETNTSQGQY